MVASLYNGTIYLRELETEENREREANMSAREKELCYWGLKFEDYMTSKSEQYCQFGMSKRQCLCVSHRDVNA